MVEVTKVLEKITHPHHTSHSDWALWMAEGELVLAWISEFKGYQTNTVMSVRLLYKNRQEDLKITNCPNEEL